jgi:hypothetical protein
MAQHASDLTLQLPPPNRAARRRAKSRRKSENRKKHPNVEPRAWTIDEWCAAYRYSRSFYEKMKREGRGPREFREGRTSRITPQADAEWRAERESKQTSV